MERLTSDPLGLVALGAAALSVVILVWFLVYRPAITRWTRLILLVGIGALPLATAGAGNIHGYLATKSRTFCGGCHVMRPYAEDSENPKSTTLAARHARNPALGEDNCYHCHADYGMFGTITTKIGGMRHVYEYLLHYRSMTLEESRYAIHLRGRYDNGICMQCHSTSLPTWNAIDDHRAALEDIRSNKTSCASAGCHGPAHPFSKKETAPPKQEGTP